MHSAYITQKNLARLKKHARDSFPNECIGFFECCKDGKDFNITDIFECKNIARNKKYYGLLPRREFKKFTKLVKKNKEVFYGVYHSHPISGEVIMGEQDKYSGTLFSVFRLQMILGIKKNKIEIAFWQIKNKKWNQRIVTRRIKNGNRDRTSLEV